MVNGNTVDLAYIANMTMSELIKMREQIKAGTASKALLPDVERLIAQRNHQEQTESLAGSAELQSAHFHQTAVRGDNQAEYQIYLACADNGKGIDVTTGNPLKTYEQWLSS